MKGAKHLSDGLYELRGHFYRRITLPSGKRSWRAIDAPNKKQARIEIFRLRNGTDETSYTVGQALLSYQRANCPDKNRNPRTGRELKNQNRRCETLLKYFGKFKCSAITAAVIDDYADWRIKHRAGGPHGGSAANLDIIVLRNAVRWAARRGDIRTNPFKLITVSSYRGPVRHCRECAPRSGDELHDIARHFFKGEQVRTQTLGWLTLLTAGIGCRISEMLALRVDAPMGQPGNISDGVLWLRRAKLGSNNFFRLKPHPHIVKCIKVFFEWRKSIDLDSPWWFPGLSVSQPMEDTSVTRALNRVGQIVAGEIRTAHGLRSFYVTCRRSAGLSDAEIALETGQVSGGREIVRTYGDATPVKVQWMPTKRKPAWEDLEIAKAQPRLRIVRKAA